MSIDLTKLTPAPWCWGQGRPEVLLEDGILDADGDAVFVNCGRGSGDPTDEDREFIALARNAFDVMMRRGWSVRRRATGRRKDMWFVVMDDGYSLYMHLWDMGMVEEGDEFTKLKNEVMFQADPYTALVEADKWYRENVENKP